MEKRLEKRLYIVGLLALPHETSEHEPRMTTITKVTASKKELKKKINEVRKTNFPKTIYPKMIITIISRSSEEVQTYLTDNLYSIAFVPFLSKSEEINDQEQGRTYTVYTLCCKHKKNTL